MPYSGNQSVWPAARSIKEQAAAVLQPRRLCGSQRHIVNILLSAVAASYDNAIEGWYQPGAIKTF